MIRIKPNSAFKALIRETSVINYYVELKDDALTKEGYFDLVKVPELYVSGAGTFIWKLRREKGLSQAKFAKLFNVTRSRVNHWEFETRRIPLQLLVKISEECGISKETIYELIDQGEFTTKNNLPVKFEVIREIVHYFSPQKSQFGKEWELTVIQSADETILKKIKSLLDVEIKSFSYGNRINSKELYTFLTTFFNYIEISKIQPPLTEEVKLWHKKRVDLKRAVIIPCLQSDGSIGHTYPSLHFYGNSQILHDYFVDAMYYAYNELPSTYLYYDRGCYITAYQRNSMNAIIAEIMKLAGNTKTKPATGQTVEEYLQEPQPHLNYLLKNALKSEQQIALRIWASAEGNIGVTKKAGYIKPQLIISCAHPDLSAQLRQLGQRLNINFFKQRSKGCWSGLLYLHTPAINSCIEFLKFGGFIKGVAISSSSPYHEGIDKDILFLGILEFKKRERENSHLRNLSWAEIHQSINNIIENKEYHTAEYYIDYFSETK